MGSGASISDICDIPDYVDLETCINLTGESFDLDIFNKHKGANNLIAKEIVWQLYSRSDVFFSHAKMTNNHRSVILDRINILKEFLSSKGLVVWSNHQATSLKLEQRSLNLGIQNAKCVLVCLTPEYVATADANSSDFEMCFTRSPDYRMIPVILHPTLRSPSTWGVVISKAMGRCPAVDATGDICDVKQALYAAVLDVIAVDKTDRLDSDYSVNSQPSLPTLTEYDEDGSCTLCSMEVAQVELSQWLINRAEITPGRADAYATILVSGDLQTAQEIAAKCAKEGGCLVRMGIDAVDVQDIIEALIEHGYLQFTSNYRTISLAPAPQHHRVLC